MMRMRRLRSAQYWLITIPASMVFTQPTSSARITARVKGVRKANSAAIHLVGFRFDSGRQRVARQFAHVIARVGAIQLVGVELGLVIAKHTILHHMLQPPVVRGGDL